MPSAVVVSDEEIY